MLMYFLIAAELAILYTAFWYIYVREPKPLKLKIAGNPWGKYGESGFTAGGIDPTLPFVFDREQTRDSSRMPGDGQPTISVLPAWLIGNATITEEFIQAWRMWRRGELRARESEADPAEEAPALVRARARRPRTRRARRCRLLLAELMRETSRANDPHEPRPPFFSRLMKIFRRTFGMPRVRAR